MASFTMLAVDNKGALRPFPLIRPPLAVRFFFLFYIGQVCY